MSRLRRAIHSVTSGYVSVVAASVYSLVSVPIALHYLSTRRFLLWGLMSSIGGYLSLIDLGMSSSLARLLVDHKDQRHEGTYGSLLKTGWMVQWLQGAIIWLAGYAAAPLFAWISNIPPDLHDEFISLMRWQTTTLAIAFPMRLFSHLLTAHQRVDIVNYSQVGTLAGSFAFQWLFLQQGHGVFSMAWGSLIAILTTAGCLGIVSVRLNLLPRAGAWGSARWDHFKEIFNYGKDLFLVGLGMQLISGSQTIIITRELGPEMGTVWYVGTRVFNLLNQVIWRIYDVCAWAFAEMMARGEKKLLLERYKTVLHVTGSLGGLFAVTYAMCNSLFVPLWMHGKRIYWPALNDVLLGVWIIEMAILHAHNSFACLTKRVGFQRYVYFVEGVVFVGSALLVTGRGGLPALILCSIVCSAVFSGPYGAWRSSRYFGVPFREIAVDWQKPLLKVLLIFVPLALAGAWATSHVPNVALHLALNALICLVAGGWAFLGFGLPGSLKEEMLRRAPASTIWALRRLLGAPSAAG